MKAIIPSCRLCGSTLKSRMLVSGGSRNVTTWDKSGTGRGKILRGVKGVKTRDDIVRLALRDIDQAIGDASNGDLIQGGGQKFDQAPQVPAGVFQRLPMVQEPEDTVNGSMRRARRIAQNKGIKNEKRRSLNWAARQLDGLTKELTEPLRQYLRGFPQPEALHPFDRELLQLTIGEQSYSTVRRFSPR